jgi:Skp family chaperone for outer membrane proteins
LEDGTLLAPALPAPPAPPAPPVPFKSSSSSQVDDEKFQDAMDKYQEMIEKNQKKYQEMVEKYQGKLQEMAEKYQKGISKTDEERRKKQKDLLEKFEARAEKNREEAQKKREKLLQSLADIKANLIETLANYGDSLTTVKSDEYINLVLNTEDPEAANKKRSDTISAQKSWITDYKAGRLSLQDFRGKVLQYTQ